MCDARLWGGAANSFRDQIARLGLAVADADMQHDAAISALAARMLRSIAGRIVVIGFSMGGIVAIEAARQAPERIVGLVLAGTNCGADLPERAAVRPGQQARARNGELAAIVGDELLPNYLAPANSGDGDMRALVLDMALSLGSETFCRQSEALRTRLNGGPVLDTFGGPALFICGADDVICPPAWHDAMAARTRRAVVRIIPGAGHLVPLEQPAAFAAAVAEWFAVNPELLRCQS